MKRLYKFLFFFIFIIIILLGIGIFLIKQNTFRLTQWDYPLKNNYSQSISDRPNILLLIAEDMSALVGAFGDEIAYTPNIDQLAKIGVRYPNTFTTAGVCSPSRAALITGMHQISIGAQHMRTGSRPEGTYLSVPPEDVKAFPELLRQAGYFTFNTAKQDYQFSGTLPGSGPFTIWDEENNSNLWRNREKGQPFFGMMNFLETHESGVFTPLGSRPNSFTHFMIQLFRKIGGLQKNKVVTIDSKNIIPPPYFPKTPTIQKDIARHYENIAAMDKIVGDILKKLKNDGLLESTIVIWTTDHGDGLPRAKRELFDSGIKVPMIIYYPEAFRPKGFQPGSIDERLISFIDFAPSFLSYAKAPIPSFLQGQNFMTADTTKRSYIFASRDRIDEVQDRQRAIRDKRFKYIKSWYPQQAGGHQLAFRDNLEMMQELWKLKEAGQLNPEQMIWFQAPEEERLFDTKNDPFELHNLSTDTIYKAELIRMQNALNHWLSQIEDWSEVAEKEMVEKFQPNGKMKKTPIPEIKEVDNLLEITAIKGASIGYQTNDDRWQLYHKPIKVSKNNRIRAKAVRYGWEESEEVVFTNK